MVDIIDYTGNTELGQILDKLGRTTTYVQFYTIARIVDYNGFPKRFKYNNLVYEIDRIGYSTCWPEGRYWQIIVHEGA